MKELFISPILYNYSYLKDLVAECSLLLDIKLDSEKKKKDFHTSIFFNFNRYLNIEIALMNESIREGFLENLCDLMESENEQGTIKMLQDVDILPETKDEFINIIKNINIL